MNINNRKVTIHKTSYMEYVVWILIFTTTLVYFLYSHPKQKISETGHWWKEWIHSYLEKRDIPFPSYTYIKFSEQLNNVSHLWDGNIANNTRDTTLQIYASGDNFPNGRKDIPFLENKAVYDLDNNLLPMYWSAACPSWLGIEFQKPQVIEHIEITPYTDMYGIGKYEILVWDMEKNKFIPTNPPSTYHGRAGKFKTFTFDKITTNRVKFDISEGGTGNNHAYIRDIKIFTSKE